MENSNLQDIIKALKEHIGEMQLMLESERDVNAELTTEILNYERGIDDRATTRI